MFTVSFNGNLGADLEVLQTDKGTALYKFRVGARTGRSKLNTDGTWTDTPTTWVRVTSFRLSDNQQAKLTTGAKVLVSGQLEISQYTSKDGELRTSYDVVADSIEVLERANQGAGNGNAPVQFRAPTKAAPVAATDLEDLPF